MTFYTKNLSDGPGATTLDTSEYVLYETIVKKKNFFYNQREIKFYQDGCFSYSKKGDKI